MRRLGLVGEQAPQTRAECANGPRPCPWVRCRYHLYLDVEVRTAHGKVRPKVRLNYAGVEVEDMTQSCALDAADEGSRTLDQVAEVLAVTRERVRQIEQGALDKLRRAMGDVLVGDDELVAMLARMVDRRG